MFTTAVAPIAFGTTAVVISTVAALVTSTLAAAAAFGVALVPELFRRNGGGRALEAMEAPGGREVSFKEEVGGAVVEGGGPLWAGKEGGGAGKGREGVLRRWRGRQPLRGGC